MDESMLSEASSFLDDSAEFSDQNGLRQEIEELKQQVDYYKAQADDALQIVKNIESIKEQNQSLIESQRKINTEKEEIESRCRMLTQKNSDLIKENDKLRQIQDENTSKSNSKKIEEVSAIKSSYVGKINTLQEKIAQLENKIEETTNKNKVLIGVESKLLDIASIHFDRSITTLDELIHIFELPAVPDVPQEESKDCQNSSTQDLIDTIHHLKEKAKLQKKEIKIISQENDKNKDIIESLKVKLSDERINYQKELSMLHQQNSQAIEQKSSAQINVQVLTQKYENQINQLKKENARLREEMLIVQDAHKTAISKPITEIAPAPKQEDKTFEIQQHYSERINQLQDQIAQLSMKKDELTKTAEINSIKATELESKLNQSELKVTRYIKLFETAKSELEKMNLVVKDYDDLTKENTNFKNKVQQQKDFIKSLQNQLYDANEGNHSGQNQINQQKGKIVELEKSIKDLTNDLTYTKEQLELVHGENAQLKVKLSKPIENNSNEIPLSIFDNFDEDLRNKISPIIFNESLMFTTKVAGISSTIKDYYMNICSSTQQSCTNKLNSIKSDFEKLKESYIDVTIALEYEPPENINDLSDHSKELVQSVQEMRFTIDQCQRELVVINDFIARLRCEFGFKDENGVQMINTLRSIINFEKEKYQKKCKKAAKLKSAITEIAKVNQVNEVQMQDTINELTQKIEILSNEKSKTAEAIQSLKKDKQALSTELDFVKNQLSDLEEEHRSTLNSNKSAVAQMTNCKSAEIEKVTARYESTISKLNSDIEESKATINRLNKVISENAGKVEQLTKEKETLEEKIEKISSDFRVQLSKEKSDAQLAFAKAAQQLTERCERAHEDIQSLSEQLASSNKRETELKIKLGRAIRRTKDAEHAKETAEDLARRERSLAEASKTSLRAQLESEAVQRIDRIRSDFESQKRSILSHVADAFRQYFDPNGRIDEATVGQTVDLAAQALERLGRSDAHIRRMLGAAEHQTTEDAVARLIVQF